MIKDIYDSFRENVSQKTSNPLLATILIVWIFKNWRLIYSFFYFEEELSLEERIAYIDNYYTSVNFYENLLISILYAFCVLVITYLLLSASKLIVNVYKRIIIPKISKWTDENSIVLKSEYNALFKLNEEIENKYSIERESKNKFKAELEAFELRFTDLVLSKEAINKTAEELKQQNEELGETNHKISAINQGLQSEIDEIKFNNQASIDLQNEYHSLKSRHKNLSKEYSELLKTRETPSAVMLQANYSDRVNEIAKLLKENDYIERYLKLGDRIITDKPSTEINEVNNYFMSLGLIKPTTKYSQVDEGSSKIIGAHYAFTNLGSDVYKYHTGS